MKSNFFRASLIVLSLLSLFLIGITVSARHRRVNQQQSYLGGKGGAAALTPQIELRSAGIGYPQIRESHSSVENNPLEYADEYHKGKNNVFFDEKDFLTRYYGGDSRKIRKLSDALMNTKSLEELPRSVNFSIDRPKVILSRMAVLTLARGYYEYDIHPDARRAAHDTFVNILTSSIPRNLPEHVKKALVAEKYDSIRILARYEREEALKLFRSVDPKLQVLLEPGIASGLRLGGISDSAVEKLLAHNSGSNQ